MPSRFPVVTRFWISDVCPAQAHAKDRTRAGTAQAKRIGVLRFRLFIPSGYLYASRLPAPKRLGHIGAGESQSYDQLNSKVTGKTGSPVGIAVEGGFAVILDSFNSATGYV